MLVNPAHHGHPLLYIWTRSPIISRSTTLGTVAIRNSSGRLGNLGTKRSLESIAFEVHVPLLQKNSIALGFLESFRVGSSKLDQLQIIYPLLDTFEWFVCVFNRHQHNTVDHSHGGQWQLSSMAVAWLRFFVQSAPPRGRRWTAFVEQHGMIRVRQGDQCLIRIENSHEWCLLNGWALLMSAKWFNKSSEPLLMSWISAWWCLMNSWWCVFSVNSQWL